MSCCGDDVIKTAKNIVVGYSRLATDNLGLTTEADFVAGRISKCHKCDESTWMNYMFEYPLWLAAHGIGVLENFSQLEKLPKLPKYEISERRRDLFCRICKCLVYAKAKIRDMICLHPEGNKWDLNGL